MGRWRYVRLGDVLTESKVESVYPNNESRIRVLLNAKGVIKRPVKKDTKGATKYFMRQKGQFIYGKQNIHKGAFGIVPDELDGFESTSDLPAFDVDVSCLPTWIDCYLKQGGFYLTLVNIARGAATKRVQPKELLELTMPLPSVGEQKKMVSCFKSIETEKAKLKQELIHQQTLLKKLRQQILQEAIEGKLTQEWRAENPDVEPASELLKRIQAEKQQLVADGKIKKQKALPAISGDEKPFALPEGWEWCRLGDYALFERGKFSIRPRNDPSCFGGNYPFIQIGSLDDLGSVITKYGQTLNEKGFSASKLFEKGTVVIAIVGGTIGNLGVLGQDMCFPDSMIGVRPKRFISQAYILMLLRHSQPLIRNLSYQMAGQPNIKLPTLNNLSCALPPLQEQKAIVTKVEKLLAFCDQLETQITCNQTHAKQLMQAVLKEAFSQGAEPDEFVA